MKHTFRFASASIPANFSHDAMEWLAPHAAHPVDLTAALVAVGFGAADVAATFAPPPDPFEALDRYPAPAIVLLN